MPRTTHKTVAKPRTPVRNKLRESDIPGVWLNKLGRQVNVDGTDLSFKDLRSKDAARWAEALDGGEVTQPADLLKAVALDPRYPTSVRIDAATRAAPYFTAKRVAVSGIDGAPPLQINDVSKLNQKDLDRLEAALATATALLEKTNG